MELLYCTFDLAADQMQNARHAEAVLEGNMEKIDDYFHTVLNDVQPILDFTPPAVPDSVAFAADNLLAPAVEIALEIVVAGSVMNVPFQRGHKLLNWIPNFQGQRESNLQKSLAPGQSSSDGSLLQELLVRVSLARSLTATLIDHRQSQGAEAQHFWDVCADAWRRAAHVNVDLIEQVLCECTQDQMMQSAHILVSQLKEVHSGDAPCVNSLDQLEIPGFAEKRSSARNTISTEAILVVDNQEHVVVVTDSSDVGYGLENAPQLIVGDAVLLRLSPLKTITARVRWWKLGRAGIEVAETELC